MHIAFLGSSLLSSYWNGAATYFRGVISALHRLGCRTTFYEPDAFERQSHRDMDPPDWARVVVYPPTLDAVEEVSAAAGTADVVVKASGVGIHDDELLTGVLRAAGARALRVFWDVDAPATLAAMAREPAHVLRRSLAQLDMVLTYGGGPNVEQAYRDFGARRCVSIYNAVDPATHFPVPPRPEFHADLSFLGNRLPDREARVGEFFFRAARSLPRRRFLLGGSGWELHRLPPNVTALGHVATADHNAFNCSARAVLNIAREDMARAGFSPATRVFEAAGAGACLITDAWHGIEAFLAPGEEILVARDGAEVAALLEDLTPARAREIGARARARVLAEHTYDKRAKMLARLLEAALRAKRAMAAA